MSNEKSSEAFKKFIQSISDFKTEIQEDGTKVYFLHRPLFFGSITDFSQGFDPAEDPKQ